MTAKPWSKFYWPDWRDPRLRMCSLAARGLWMDMLSLMHEGVPYGHLLINGVAPSARQLASLVGAAEREVIALLAMLDEAGVFSKTDNGTIYSRRMVRDAERSSRDKANGSMGGNPQLKAGVNPQDKTQKSGARNQESGRVPLSKINGLISHAASSEQAVSREEKRRRWAANITTWLYANEDSDRADQIVEGWQRGEQWAREQFERVDKILKANKGAA